MLVPYSKDLVKDAPRIEHDGDLSPEEADRLYRHYQLSGTGDARPESLRRYSVTEEVTATPRQDADRGDR